MRAPFQVIVIPFIARGELTEYAIMCRSDADYWQPVAGGGESDETPPQAAVREVCEESGLEISEQQLLPLPPDYFISVFDCFGRFLWGPRVTVIPQHFYAFEAATKDLVISSEHTAYCWVNYPKAMQMLYWEDNRHALTRLHRQLVGHYRGDRSQAG